MGQLNTIPLEICVNYSKFFLENDLFVLSLLNKNSFERYFKNDTIWKCRVRGEYRDLNISIDNNSYCISYLEQYREDYCFKRPSKLRHSSYNLFKNEMCSSIAIFDTSDKKIIFGGGYDGSVYRLSKSSTTEYNKIVKLNLKDCTMHRNDEWVRVLENIDNKVLAIGKGNQLIIYPVNDTEINSINDNNYNSNTLLAQHAYEAHAAAIHDVKCYDNFSCVTVSFDCKIKLWDLIQQKCLSTFLPHDQQIYGVTTCCQKNLIITSSYDHFVNIYDTRLKSTAPIQCYDHKNPAWFTKPKTFKDIDDLNVFLSSCSDGKIREWDIRMNQTDPVCIYANVYNDCSCNSFDISYHNSNLICGYDDGRFSVFNLNNQELVFTKATHSRYIRKVAVLSMLNDRLHKYVWGTNDGTIGIMNDGSSGYKNCDEEKPQVIELRNLCSGVKDLAIVSSNTNINEYCPNEIIYGGTNGELGIIKPI